MITLKLDTNTVRELFPEGSEMRLELQRSVIQNIIGDVVKQKYKTEVGNEISRYFSEHGLDINTIIKAELGRYFTGTDITSYRSTVDTNTMPYKSALTKIRENLHKQAEALIGGMLSDAVSVSNEELEERVKKFTEATLSLNENKMRDIVVRELNKNFKQIMTSAIDEKFK